MGIVVEFAQAVAFTAFGVEFPYYGLCCLLGTIAFTVLLELELARKNMDSDAWLILILAFVGARVGAKSMYCLNDELAMSGWKQFGSCVFVSAQGGSFQGGFILATSLIMGYTKFIIGEKIVKLCDILGPLAMLGYGFGKIGCFTSGDGC